MNVDYIIGGNIYSLCDKTNFATRTTSAQSYEFNNLFKNQTHLIEANKLTFGNVTTLTDGCYYCMFQGCTSLTATPELPATTLVSDCYQRMFDGCTSLNAVKCLAEDISVFGCTLNWLRNVSATGTFYKSANMSGWTTGNSGIPSGWTVVDA